MGKSPEASKIDSKFSKFAASKEDLNMFAIKIARNQEIPICNEFKEANELKKARKKKLKNRASVCFNSSGFINTFYHGGLKSKGSRTRLNISLNKSYNKQSFISGDFNSHETQKYHTNSSFSRNDNSFAFDKKNVKSYHNLNTSFGKFRKMKKSNKFDMGSNILNSKKR